MKRPALPEGVVHIWYGTVPQSLDMVAGQQTLSDDERRRAASFVFDRDRRRFIARRRALRHALSGYLGTPPQEVAFELTPHKRPMLAGAMPPLLFNISHSEDDYCFAVAAQGPLGIDIEMQRPIDEFDSLSASVCSPAERAQLGAIGDPHERHSAFFRCWARKEAFLKATGVGLVDDLQGIDVGAEEGDRLLPGVPGLWDRKMRLRQLPRPGGMKMAICTGDVDCELLWFTPVL